MIGDQFIHDGFGMMQQMKSDAQMPREVPFILDYFDVKQTLPPDLTSQIISQD